MTLLLFASRAIAALALTVAACGTWASTGSLYRGCTHVGLRPAASLEGVGATVQVTTDWGCR